MGENAGRITATVELWRENGQWRMTLRAPSWVLEDLSRTMNAQSHPPLLVMASSLYADGETRHIHFTTWGGGAIGSPPPKGSKFLVLTPPDND